MAKILIFGNPNSPLVSQRGLIASEWGYEVDWFWATAFSLPGVQSSFTMPGWLAKRPWSRALLEPLYLALALRRSQPDLVHVHYASRMLSVLPLLNRHPLIVTVMGSDVSPVVAYRGVARPFVKALLDHADMITTKSEQMDQMVLNIGNYAQKLERVTWGIDLTLFHGSYDTAALRQRLAIPAGSLIFYDPRAAKPLYNKHLILRAFSDYLRQGGVPAVLLVSQFSAESGYLRQLTRLVEELKLGAHVRFLQPADPEGMAFYYALADVVVSIPNSDGFPQTIYEAWASGCYLILADLPQYRSAVQEGRAATLISSQSRGDLAAAMISVANSPDLRSAHVDAARAFVSKYADATQQKLHVLNLYSKLLHA